MKTIVVGIEETADDLVATGPGPRTWIVGHLGNPQVLQAFLDAALEPTQ